MKHIYKFFFAMTFMLAASSLFAQNGMEEYFFESGKIKVVVVVASLVLAGLIIYIISLEGRLRKLENRK